MMLTLLDNHLDTPRTRTCVHTLAGHDVTEWRDHSDDVGVLADRHAAAQVLVLIRARTRPTRDLFERPLTLRLISPRRSGAQAARGLHRAVPLTGDDYPLFATDTSRHRIPPHW